MISARQFARSYRDALHRADNPEPGQFPTGSQVHNADGRPGIVTAQHVDREHVNVQWKRGVVDVMHVKDIY